MQTDDLKAAHDHLYNEKLAAEKSNKNLQISAAEVGKKLSDGHLQLQDADSFNKKSANENGTKYFLQISPDINFDFDDLKIFIKEAEKLKDNFAALGPQFLNVKEKSHKQSDPKIAVAPIKFIHGSVMFINRDVFNLLNGFDENFFLYFEETDYCKRAIMKGFKCYQINSIKVKNEGRSVKIEKTEEKAISNILAWHFIWSKFYYYKKHYGFIMSILFFTPVIIRIFFRLFINFSSNNKENYERYKFRLNGLKTSIKGKKSALTPTKLNP